MLMLGTPRGARAFVRYKTSAGLPFAWAQTCISLTVYPNDFTDLTPDQTMHAVTAAAAAWSADLNVCTFMRIQVNSSMAATPTATLDGRNSVIFRSTSWCAPNDLLGICSYPPESLAITSVFVRKSDGKILDADIEVNAKNYVWGDLALAGAGSGKQDLQNTLTHEMGHVLGLDNTCVPAGTSPVPLDDNGLPVPSCDSASPAVQATTMFDSHIPGDISKRTLAPDDILGVCTVYPIASDPMVCPSSDADGGSDGVRVDGAAEVSADGPADSAAEVGSDGAEEVAVDGVVDGNADEAAGHGGAEAGAADGPVAQSPATTAGCGCDVNQGGPRVVDFLAIAAFILAGHGRRARSNRGGSRRRATRSWGA